MIDYRMKVKGGSFLPAMALLKSNEIEVEAPVDEVQGLRILHYAAYFGKIKALSALSEEFHADIGAIDYRGQTPLHIATNSGEIGALVFLSA